jgi:hypothetical protein
MVQIKLDVAKLGSLWGSQVICFEISWAISSWSFLPPTSVVPTHHSPPHYEASQNHGHIPSIHQTTLDVVNCVTRPLSSSAEDG